LDTGKRIAPPRLRAPEEALALYVHIPFCETKCPYCDFNTYARLEALIPDYVPALQRELELWGSLLQTPQTSTIFFGGGTPSYLPLDDLGRVISTINSGFDVNSDAEISLEANPGDIDARRAAALRNIGFNRVSVGIQSFDDGLLQMLGRKHDAETAVAAIHSFRDGGFDSINLDLMFGLPNQTLQHWEASLVKALELDTEHISLYGLTIEPNTPLEVIVERGDLPEPDADLAADMYLLACERLEAASYLHYEISNWCKPDKLARHNLIYWRSGEYLGAGPGAHSYVDGQRFENNKSPRHYVQALQAVSSRSESIDAVAVRKELGVVGDGGPDSARQQSADFLMMGLRLSEGISAEEISNRFGVDFPVTYRDEITQLQSSGLLATAGDRYWIPHDKWLLGNEVFSQFVELVQITEG
jgi:oxygen-independent coproporphyrinogen-3 oxidase